MALKERSTICAVTAMYGQFVTNLQMGLARMTGGHEVGSSNLPAPTSWKDKEYKELWNCTAFPLAPLFLPQSARIDRLGLFLTAVLWIRAGYGINEKTQTPRGPVFGEQVNSLKHLLGLC